MKSIYFYLFFFIDVLYIISQNIQQSQRNSIANHQTINVIYEETIYTYPLMLLYRNERSILQPLDQRHAGY